MATRQHTAIRRVALPSEHGGWSLTLEPVILGLIVAPGAAGVALGFAALFAFLARTPLKLVMIDRRQGRRLGRTTLAERIGAGYVAGLLAALLVAALVAVRPFWAVLALAAPLVVVSWWFDIRSRGRRLIPELAGTVGIGAVGAAIVLAGGGSWGEALGAWTIVAARAIAAIPFVRLQLRRAKQQPHRVAGSDAAQVAATAIAAAGTAAGIVPPLATAVVAGLAAVHLTLARRPAPAAPVLGAQQVVLGLTVVVTAGLAMAAP